MQSGFLLNRRFRKAKQSFNGWLSKYKPEQFPAVPLQPKTNPEQLASQTQALKRVQDSEALLDQALDRFLALTRDLIDHQTRR